MPELDADLREEALIKARIKTIATGKPHMLVNRWKWGAERGGPLKHYFGVVEAGASDIRKMKGRLRINDWVVTLTAAERWLKARTEKEKKE